MIKELFINFYSNNELNNKELTNLEFEDSFDNYEEALEEGLYEALKLIKDET